VCGCVVDFCGLLFVCLNDVLVFVANQFLCTLRQRPYTPRCCNVSTPTPIRHFSRKFNLARSDTFWREFERELESDVAGKKKKNGTQAQHQC
jgi:hypothetical protein